MENQSQCQIQDLQRKLLSIALFCTVTFNICSQSVKFCGDFPFHEATTSNPDSIFYDRFGNSYNLDTWVYSQDSIELCGYYELHFSGIADSLRNTICEVFSYLSGEIELRTNITTCGDIADSGPLRIYVYYDTNLDSMVASATPLYGPFPASSDCDEVRLDRVSAKINGGRFFSSTSFDAGLGINPASWIHWHISTLSSPTGTELDLFSVILHESLHILGFASRISENGNASMGYFSMWDRLIQVTEEFDYGNMGDVFPLLTGNCISNCWSVDSTIFPELADLDSAFANNCSLAGDLDFVIGQNLAPLVGGFLAPTNFSHLFSDTCNNDDTEYVMSPVITPGAESEKRIINDREIEILCLLGYKTTNCEGCFISEIHEVVQLTGAEAYNTCCDPTFTGCVNDTFEIMFDQLLCNDFTNGEAIEIAAFRYDPSNIDVMMTPNSFLIVSDAQGRYTVDYTIKACECNLVTSTFEVYILPCPDCSEVDPCENLTCVNGFQQYSTQVSQVGLVMELVEGEYWVFRDSRENTPDICNASGNRYLHIGANPSIAEGVAIKLSESLFPGCRLSFNMTASAQEEPVTMYLYGSKDPPCSFLNGRIEHGPVAVNCGEYIFMPHPIDTVIVSNPASNLVGRCANIPNLLSIGTIQWINESDDEINYLIIAPDVYDPNRSVYIDDIVATSFCIDPTFSHQYIEDCNEVVFIPTIQNPSLDYLWDFGDGDTSSVIKPSHLYDTVGSYTVELFLSDNCGNIDSFSLNVIVNGDQTLCCPDTIISSTTTWATAPHDGRFHTITVERGVAFTIDGSVTLEFCEGGALVIEAGAYVDLEGTLTSYGDMVWEGVFVSGDSSLNQYNDLGGGGYNGLQQGYLETREGATIKNARIGVRNYGPAGTSSSGGMIRCYKTQFLNNRIGADFIDYQNFSPVDSTPRPSLGSFRQCKFYTMPGYHISEPFHSFARLRCADGMDFRACKFYNTVLPGLPSEVSEFGFGIHAVDAGFKVHAMESGGGLGLCPPPCILSDSTEFKGLGHGIYNMTRFKTRPYELYHAKFENCFRGLTDLTRGGATILFNTFLLDQVPDPDFSYGQIGAEFHFEHNGFTLQENRFIGTDGSEVVPIGVLCNNLGEFDNEIRRNTFIGVETANQAFGVNRDNNIVLPRGLRYFCNSFEETPSHGYDFHIPNTQALDLIHLFQTPGSSQGSNASNGNHFAYSAHDFMNFGEGEINYWYYPPGDNEEPRDFFSLGLGKFQGDSNACEVIYCAPPCVEDIEDIKGDFINSLDRYEENLDNYLDALVSENQLKIDTARSKALYYQRLSSRDAYTTLQHLMIDTLEYNADSLIRWMGYFDTYGAEIMIAGEYASRTDFESAIDTLESIAAKRDLSPAQSVDLEHLLDIYYLLEEKSLQTFSSSDRSFLRNTAYLNSGVASGVSRALLSSFEEYIPLPNYHGEQINFRTATQDTSHTIFVNEDHIPLKIYPNPTDGDVIIEWEDQGFNCVSLNVFNIFGEEVLGLNGDLTSPYSLSTSPCTNGMHWIIARDNNGNTISGKFIVQRN